MTGINWDQMSIEENAQWMLDARDEIARRGGAEAAAILARPDIQEGIALANRVLGRAS